MIAKGWDVRLRVIEDRFLILISDGRRPPVERFTAVVVAISRQDDLAVLRIRGDAEGRVLDLEQLVFPFVSLGDSNTVELGDPVHVFGYPGIGGGSLTYTSGVVSGFYFDEAGIEPAWIISDATIAPGNSGGTAVDAQGRLIGVPTMTRSVDRTSDDVVGDGAFDDVSAALGGSLAWLLPINVAKPLLSEIAPEFFAPADEEQVASNE
jgi:S1-C subfamily serine protease